MMQRLPRVLRAGYQVTTIPQRRRVFGRGMRSSSNIRVLWILLLHLYIAQCCARHNCSMLSKHDVGHDQVITCRTGTVQLHGQHSASVNGLLLSVCTRAAQHGQSARCSTYSGGSRYAGVGWEGVKIHLSRRPTHADVLTYTVPWTAETLAFAIWMSNAFLFPERPTQCQLDRPQTNLDRFEAEQLETFQRLCMKSDRLHQVGRLEISTVQFPGQ